MFINENLVIPELKYKGVFYSSDSMEETRDAMGLISEIEQQLLISAHCLCNYIDSNKRMKPGMEKRRALRRFYLDIHYRIRKILENTYRNRSKGEFYYQLNSAEESNISLISKHVEYKSGFLPMNVTHIKPFFMLKISLLQ